MFGTNHLSTAASNSRNRIGHGFECGIPTPSNDKEWNMGLFDGLQPLRELLLGWQLERSKALADLLRFLRAGGRLHGLRDTNNLSEAPRRLSA